MLGAHLTALHDTDPGIVNALDLVAGFDDALVHGFARLGEERAAALAALAAAMAVTPLGERVGEAVDKVAAGSIADEHLVALAGARTALFGAVHDSLLAALDAALGRHRTSYATPPHRSGDEHPNLLAGSRSWLRELAIAGWRGVDHDLVSGAAQTLQAVLAVPSQRRLAVLLDGLAAELRAAAPIATMDRLPVRRWADLWSRALLLSQPGGAQPDPAPVSGRLLILGADVHEHATAVQVQVHGILETTDAPRLVRASISAPKVDTIVGPAVWQLLQPYKVLLHALAAHTAVAITELPMLPSGDLIWDDARARPDEPADPFATARLQLPAAVAPAVPPLQRHPAGIAEPVLIEGYVTATADTGELTLTLPGGPSGAGFQPGPLDRGLRSAAPAGGPGAGIAVATGRLPACGPLTRELVAASSACIGLLRWDAGRWSIQPLALQATVKKAAVAVHNGDWAQGITDAKAAKAEAKAGDAVSVLRERAGRLLRK
jgi:hypothetical protein